MESEAQRKRHNIIKEIRETESDYVKDLQIIVDVFVTPLKQQDVISSSEITNLFSNVAVILNVNQNLNNELLANEDDDSILIGDIFLQMAEFFKTYTSYCANQPKAMVILDELSGNPSFTAFTNQCMENTVCRGLTLFSFLIKPIQRICKYPLLLKDLLRNTPAEHPDYKNLVAALEKIEEVVQYVNERKRLAENLQKILELQSEIESKDELRLVSPSRRFVREGKFQVAQGGKPRERTLYLFNDLVVVTKPRKSEHGKDHYRFMFSLGQVKVIDVADIEERKNAMEVHPKNPEEDKVSCVIIFPSPEDKSLWLKEIKKFVKEFQRKQYLESQRKQPTVTEQISRPPIPELSRRGSSPMRLLKKLPSSLIVTHTEETNTKQNYNVDWKQLMIDIKDPESGVKIKTRKWMLRKYPECFVGSEAVTWICEYLKIEDRKEAVNIGSALLEKSFIRHVADDHPFLDKSLFYSFTTIDE